MAIIADYGFYKNGEIIRTFSRNLATENKSDMDMVRFFVCLGAEFLL